MQQSRPVERRVTFQEIAQRADTSHTRVRKIVASGILGSTGYQPGNRDGLPEDAGELIATILRAHVASPTTAQIMQSDPSMVLEAALALAELARRQIQGVTRPADELAAA